MCCVLLCFTGGETAFAKETQTDYEKDYISRIYNSESGLEGTAVKCIYASEEGFLWFGSYTGLYRYDGTEFKKYLIDDRSLTVTDIIQDAEGTLWIGTNGEGLYYFDGDTFVKYKIDQEQDAEGIITKLFLDTQGNLFVGTKGGVFRLDPKQKRGIAFRYPELAGSEIRDIGELSANQKIVIEKKGRIFLLEGEQARETKQSASAEEGLARCISRVRNGYFYIGTVENEILKVSTSGKVLKVIDGAGLTSFNSIYEFEEGKFWVCSDTGIGVLENDTVTKQQLSLDDSVEEVCTDYQGSYWFASSRQGVMQLYENGFSDLGAYWRLKQTINSVQCYHEKIYVACDSGLYCYQGKQQVEDALTKACQGIRVRQIYQDEEENLWVSTYQGIKVLKNTGDLEEYHTKNSGLETNQIRSIRQDHTGRILIGTEDGLFVMDQQKQISRLTDDENLNTKRILDLTDYDGKIYVATDGYGVFEIKDDKVETVYSKQQGLSSGSVMKVVPSKQMKGVWLVEGEEICFLNQYGTIQKVTGMEIANSLDLLLTDDGEALIIAGNGIFRIKETDLLKSEPEYQKLNRGDGIPIDFTANAGNMIQDNVLYLCGTTGAASMDLQKESSLKEVRSYLKEITADGEAVDIQKDNILLPSKTSRVNIDIRCIDFRHQNLWISYQMEDIDRKPVWLEDGAEQNISYMNLQGGNYSFHYQIYDENAKNLITQMDVQFRKDYSFWELPKIRKLLIYIIVGAVILLNFLILLLRDNVIKKRYRIKLQEEKEEEIAKLAYTDMVTGVYNRNRFELVKEKLDMKEVYAFFLVSVNYQNYVLNKYGHSVWEKILDKAVQSLKECNTGDTELYRMADNIFAFWITESVNLEEFVHRLKETFQEKGNEKEVPLSFAVGGVYNNRVDKEKIDDLMERCEKIRLLDEKHADAKFIEGKVKVL